MPKTAWFPFIYITVWQGIHYTLNKCYVFVCHLIIVCGISAGADEPEVFVNYRIWSALKKATQPSNENPVTFFLVGVTVPVANCKPATLCPKHTEQPRTEQQTRQFPLTCPRCAAQPLQPAALTASEKSWKSSRNQHIHVGRPLQLTLSLSFFPFLLFDCLDFFSVAAASKLCSVQTQT